MRPVRPYQLQRINAGSAVVISYSIADDSLGLVTLATDGLRYRIDNLTDGRQILDWQTVTGSPPPSIGTITVPATLNVVSEGQDTRLNQVTIEATTASGSVTQQIKHYEIAAVYQGIS